MTLDRERDLLDRGLTAAGLGWDDWPASAVDRALDDRMVLATLLLLLAEREHRARITVAFAPFDSPGPDTIDRLRRRRLPWDPGTAALALDVVRRHEDEFDDRRVSVALRGAEQVCVAGEADAMLVQRLQTCRDWLDGLREELEGVPQARLLVRRVIAATSPPDILDLSLLLEGDGWGERARELARAGDPDVVAPLVRLLGGLGSRKPSQRWLRDCAELVAPPDARTLLEGWLQLAADSPIIAAGTRLFTPGNDDVVRAAVLATTQLPSESWVPSVLGILARRGAASSHLPGMTEALALKVASASIDALASRGTAGDRDVLEELLEDLSRRDLVKRVGIALGRQSDAELRDAELRRTKAAAVRRKADPAPRRARASVDVLLRRHLLPVLRQAGFEGRDRTWRRFHPDRVDVVVIGSGGSEVSVSYGVRFDAAHPPGEAYPVERDEVGNGQFDLSVSSSCHASAESLEQYAEHLLAHVVPFLDSLGRYEQVRAYFERRAGTPSGAESMDNPGSPMVDGVLGLLALAAGDGPTAVGCLARRVAFAESTGSWGDQAAYEGGLRFWRDQLRLAQLLST